MPLNNAFSATRTIASITTTIIIINNRLSSLRKCSKKKIIVKPNSNLCKTKVTIIGSLMLTLRASIQKLSKSAVRVT